MILRPSEVLVEAYPVTIENMEAISRWCQGVLVRNPMAPALSYVEFGIYSNKVFVGEWLLRDEKGEFVAKTPAQIWKDYELASLGEDNPADPFAF